MNRRRLARQFRPYRDQAIIGCRLARVSSFVSTDVIKAIGEILHRIRPARADPLQKGRCRVFSVQLQRADQVLATFPDCQVSVRCRFPVGVDLVTFEDANSAGSGINDPCMSHAFDRNGRVL